jgi:hypothetical protein
VEGGENPVPGRVVPRMRAGESCGTTSLQRGKAHSQAPCGVGSILAGRRDAEGFQGHALRCFAS